jgi:hypothetical protein
METKILLIEPQYLPNTDYFALLNQYQKVCFDVHSHYERRSFRNRARILNAEKITDLIIPVHLSGHHTPLHEVRLDKQQRWQEIHFRSFQSFYGKAAFWIYYGKDFEEKYCANYEFLADFTIDFIHLAARKMGISFEYSRTEKFIEGDDLFLYDDFRDKIHPRKASVHAKFPPYLQVFSTEFVPNISGADLLLTQGKFSKQFLPKNVT